jgi:two-component system response regulator
MSARPIVILLVEDDPAEAELTMRSLRQHEVASRLVIRVRDGEEALDFLFCRGPYAGRNPEDPPSLVLLDLKLPRLDGHEVLRRIKSDDRLRSVPVVVLSSSDHERDLRECYRLGANSYIQKPVDLEKFQHTVRALGLYWFLVNHMPPVSSFQRAGDGENS